MVSVEPASPPICIRFSDNLDNIARAEGQIIGFLHTCQCLIGKERVKHLPIRCHCRPTTPLLAAHLAVVVRCGERAVPMVVWDRQEVGAKEVGLSCLWSVL